MIGHRCLWAREAAEGETEEPVAVGARLPRSGGDAFLRFPITGTKPASERPAIEILATEKRPEELGSHLRLWIILDGCNEDIVGRPYHLQPGPPLGRFSSAFFPPVMRTRGVGRL